MKHVTTSTDLKNPPPLTLESLREAVDALPPKTLERADLLKALEKSGMNQPILLKGQDSRIEDVGDLVSEVVISKYMLWGRFYLLDRHEWSFWKHGKMDLWKKLGGRSRKEYVISRNMGTHPTTRFVPRSSDSGDEAPSKGVIKVDT